MTTCNYHQKCIEYALEHAEKLCKKHNLLFTKLRKTIFALIWQSHIPLKAYDILKELQKSDTSAQPVTVYRALDFLVKNHMVHKLESNNSFFGCTHPGQAHNCYFLICKICQKVEEICQNRFLQNIHQNIKNDNFTIERITLEVSGRCKTCYKR